MQKPGKILQGLGIPHSAMLSIVFGLLVLSFPVGAHIFFGSGLGGQITHEYPLAYVDTVVSPLADILPFEADLGDGFIVMWSAYALLFAVGMAGPRKNIIGALVPVLSSGNPDSPRTNYAASAIQWFGVLVLASAVIDYAQRTLFGVEIRPPDFGNDLVWFLSASMAPVVEELGFRVVLIGIPLYVVLCRRAGPRALARFLWSPSSAHGGDGDGAAGRRVMAGTLALIAGTGILFGLAHILVGEPWSGGKFAQAAAAGVILGWVYYRHGLLAAILLHWATNYAVLSYVYLVAHAADITVTDAFSHPMLGTLELVLVSSGAVSAAFMLAGYLCSRKTQSARGDDGCGAGDGGAGDAGYDCDGEGGDAVGLAKGNDEKEEPWTKDPQTGQSTSDRLP